MKDLTSDNENWKRFEQAAGANSSVSLAKIVLEEITSVPHVSLWVLKAYWLIMAVYQAVNFVPDLSRMLQQRGLSIS